MFSGTRQIEGRNFSWKLTAVHQATRKDVILEK